MMHGAKREGIRMSRETVDLGELSGPILLFGGPYSNLRATQALMAEAARRSIPADRMICTGDVCAYAAEAEETAQAVRALGCPVVAGNCEDSLGFNALDCGCGFEEGATCDRLSAEWFAHATQQVSEETRAWMRGLPGQAIFSHAGKRYVVVHGGAEQINAFIWPTDSVERKAKEVRLLEAALGRIDAVVCGHSGVPFVENVGAHEWINAGAIGLPGHDGDPRTSFAVLENGEVELHRLRYDNVGAAAAMEQVGLTAGYHETLRSGWWPSEDTFPPEMRRGVTSNAFVG